MSTTAELIEVAEAAELLGVSVRTLRHRCAEGRIPGAVKQDGGWRIPRETDTRLHGVAAPECRGLDRLDEVAADKLADAQRKAGIVAEAGKFVAAAVREGSNRSNALAAFCSSKQIGHGTLYRWMADWKQEGIEGLIDSRGKGKFETDTISGDAWEWFKSAWLDSRQPTVKTVWQALQFHNQQHNKGWVIPSLRTMYDQIEKRIPLPVQVLHRQGQAAYEARCAPYILTDPDSIEPGSVFIGDHHELDIKIQHRGKWTRPWLTAWEDRRSRTIVGHTISLSPNQTTIMLAFKQACEKYGPPDAVKIDNGRDYDSEMWTGTTKRRRRVLGKGYLDESAVCGIYAMMNIAVSFAIPYHPQSKPIERFFATLESQFCKAFPTYCGSKTDRKPEDHQEFLGTRKAADGAYTIETLAPMVDRYIAAYNSTAHTGQGMEGRSPNEVMATRKSRRVLVDGVLDLICRVWSGELTVGKNGVQFKGLWFGQYSTALLMHQGRKVRVSYDPGDLTSVQVYDAASWNFITTAEQAQLVGYGVGADETALREAMTAKARANKIVKGFRSAARTKNMDLTSLTIETMESRQNPDPVGGESPALRPAASPISKPAAIPVRKAAGAEQVTHVRDFDIDYDAMRSQKADLPEFDIDFDAMRKTRQLPKFDLDL